MPILNPIKVRQTFLDRLIEHFWPEWGHARLGARVMLSAMKRNYSAGDRGRRTEGWSVTVGNGPNAALKKSLPLIRERSRDLVRNNPWAGSMHSEVVANMTHFGIVASFSRKPSGNGKDLDAEVVLDLWNGWAETTQIDTHKTKDLYDIQRLAVSTWAESGECFIRRTWRPDWKPGEIPFALQVLEPEFIDQSKDGRDNTKMGIKFDDNGARLGYWVYKRHPGESITEGSIFVPAEEMIHLYWEGRPGQIRGVPIMAPSILRLNDLDGFEQGELIKQEIASYYAGFIKKKDGYGQGNSEQQGTGTRAGFNRLEPGAFEVLGPDEDIVFSNPPQRSGYPEFVKQNLLAATAPVGPTYEAVSGDFGRVTFLNGRMGQLRFHRRVDQWQWLMFIPKVCNRIAEWFRQGALVAGYDLSEWQDDWQPPVKQMVDPEKELNASEKAVRMGTKTQFELIRENGKDPIPFLDSYREAQGACDERGITLTTDVRKISDAGQTQNTGQQGTEEEEAEPDDSQENPDEE